MAFACILARSAAAKPAPRAATPTAWPYVLQVSEAKATVTLRNTRTQRVVWTRTLEKGMSGTAEWSPDHRALAYETGRYILLWREGSPPLKARWLVGSHRQLGDGDGYDYTMGYVWSPDNRWILIRFGASASTDMGPNGAGPVYCLKLSGSKHPRYKWLSPPTNAAGLVWKVGWRDSKTALYWPFDYERFALVRTPRVWRVP